MKILPVSDLHRELWRAPKFWDNLDGMKDVVLVLAGDIFALNYRRQDDWEIPLLLEKFRAVVYVVGNHEFYGNSPQGVDLVLGDLKEEYGSQGLHILDRTTCKIDDQRFVGCTLWISRPAPETPNINDVHRIKRWKPWVFAEHRRCMDFLDSQVTSTDIVVTHHGPSHGSTHPKYAGNELNVWFVAPEAERIIVERQPRLWIHGHTHDSHDYQIGATRVLCNPMGYQAEGQDLHFNPRLILEVP